MKILIISDTHGRNINLESVIKKVEPIDLLIHLGDFARSADYIKNLVSCDVEMVSGNNDIFTDIERDKIIIIDKYRVFLTHGHKYRVNMSKDFIKQYAINNKIDIVMFGHTHKPIIEYDEGITFINPGSLTEPRQDNRKPSYMIMEIDRHGEVHFTINYVK